MVITWSLHVTAQNPQVWKNKQCAVVLTYDDGPDPKYTKEILDTLAYYHVPATFFVVGLEAENNIPLIKRILREGHEIGNHTFTHPDMSKVSRDRALLEMDATKLSQKRMKNLYLLL